MSKRNLTTSILGDAGAAEATVVPNLESLNTGSDAYVTSISDTSEFNVFQQLKIYDNYWDTLFARHIVNAANAGAAPSLLSQVNIQGNTEGWCRADHMALMVPITFTYAWEYVRLPTDANIPSAVPTLVAYDNPEASYNMADASLATGTVTNATANKSGWPAGTYPIAFPWENTVGPLLNNAATIFDVPDLNKMKHNWIGVLDVFERLRILIGNNGQMLQKQIETEPIGMKYHMSTIRCGKVLLKALSEWGLQSPCGFEINDMKSEEMTSAWYTELRALYYSTNGITDSHTENAGLYLKFLSKVSSISNYDTRSVIRGIEGSTARICTTTRTKNLTLPLQGIIPFFRGAKFLPPDFRFKFEIEINSGRMIAKKYEGLVLNTATGATVATAGTPGAITAAPYAQRTASGCYSQISARANAAGIELHYPYHILRQPVQAAISAMWLQKPFLYNYETIQTTEIIPSQGTTYINFAISISTQRPTVLDAYLFPISSMSGWETDYVHVVPWTNTSGTAIPTGYRIKNTPHNHGDYTTGTALNKNSATDCGPCVWNDLEIMFSGRTAYRFLNNYMTTHSMGNDSMSTSEFFVQLFEEQSFRSTATEYNAQSAVEQNLAEAPYMVNSHHSHKLLRLIVQPGGWADRGVISSRQGATTVTININFKKALSANDRFVVFRTNPEQLVFDSDKNVNIIQWPAIKSNMGYLIPNITAAP